MSSATALTDDDAGALAVSLVDFRTGLPRRPLRRSAMCIGPDRLLIVDAIQGFGMVDVDYDRGRRRRGARLQVAPRRTWHRLRLVRTTRAQERLEPVLSGFVGMDVDGFSVHGPASGGHRPRRSP